MRLTRSALAGVVLAETGLTTWGTIVLCVVFALGVIVIWQLVRFKEALTGLEDTLEEQAQKIAKLQRVAGLTTDEE